MTTPHQHPKKLPGTLPHYFPKTKKRRLSPESTSSKEEPPTKMNNKVSFVQKGMLSPVKKSAEKKEAPDLKKLLSRAGKLEELRGVLGKWRELEVERGKVKGRSSAEISEVVKSPVKQKEPSSDTKSNIFTSPVKLKDISGPPPPAFKRFHHLLAHQPTAPSTQPPAPTPPLVPTPPTKLPLPHSHTLLLHLFTSVETSLSLLTTRSELPTFPKIKSSVAQLLRTVHLKESHLAQFLSVLPNCYQVTRENRELVVKFPTGHKHTLHGRRDEFEAGLRAVVLREHETFLLALTPPLRIPSSKVTRYHPKFPLEKTPPIPPAELPPIPKETILSAQELISRAKGLVGNHVTTHVTAITAATAGSLKRPDLNKLKGVSRALIEKIRQRETQKLAASLTTPPPQLKRHLLLEKLPPLIPILRNMFNLEKKCSILFEVVVERCVHSRGGGVTRSEIIELIELLASVAPKFLQIIKLEEKWVKLNVALEQGDVVGGIRREVVKN